MNFIDRTRRWAFAVFAVLFASVCSSHAGYTSATPPSTGPTVPGNRAALDKHTGIAYAPDAAPECVKRAIWATNFLRNKPYVWGGGHESFYVDGYDCSGSVSFLLHHAGLISRPVVSREFTSYGNGGKGRWITIYARDGHVFAVVAGLRLDTTGFGAEDGPRWRLGGGRRAGLLRGIPKVCKALRDDVEPLTVEVWPV